MPPPSNSQAQTDGEEKHTFAPPDNSDMPPLDMSGMTSDQCRAIHAWSKRMLALWDDRNVLKDSHASSQKRIGALEAVLDSLEADAVNLRCALQSTAHMAPEDQRIPVITGQVVKDLLVMRNKARAALAVEGKT